MQKFTVERLSKGKYYGLMLTGSKLYCVEGYLVTHNTSFHASAVVSPDGFAHQGANCVVLCNEEDINRVAGRYLTAATGMSLAQIRKNEAEANRRWSKVRDNVHFRDATGKDLNWVEGICKTYQPDILILDMGDKFVDPYKTFAREDQALKHNAIHARQIAKIYEGSVFYMSQLSAEAEGKVILNQSMMEGSKTGKAAEADLMLLVARNPVEMVEEEDPQRHITFAKNKINGWHGVVHCELDAQTARYSG